MAVSAPRAAMAIAQSPDESLGAAASAHQPPPKKTHSAQRHQRRRECRKLARSTGEDNATSPEAAALERLQEIQHAGVTASFNRRIENLQQQIANVARRARERSSEAASAHRPAERSRSPARTLWRPSVRPLSPQSAVSAQATSSGRTISAVPAQMIPAWRPKFGSTRKAASAPGSSSAAAERPSTELTRELKTEPPANRYKKCSARRKEKNRLRAEVSHAAKNQAPDQPE